MTVVGKANEQAAEIGVACSLDGKSTALASSGFEVVEIEQIANTAKQVAESTRARAPAL